MTFSAPGSIIRPRTILRHERQPSVSQSYAICSSFSNGLGNVYPGHLWQVHMNQNMVSVFCASLSKTHCYTCHIEKFDIEGKKLILIGAEMLERFGVSRGKDGVEQADNVERDLKGDATPEQ